MGNARSTKMTRFNVNFVDDTQSLKLCKSQRLSNFISLNFLFIHCITCPIGCSNHDDPMSIPILHAISKFNNSCSTATNCPLTVQNYCQHHYWCFTIFTQCEIMRSRPRVLNQKYQRHLNLNLAFMFKSFSIAFSAILWCGCCCVFGAFKMKSFKHTVDSYRAFSSVYKSNSDKCGVSADIRNRNGLCADEVNVF